MGDHPQWPEGKKERLRRLWAVASNTRPMIAEIMGVSLNAVVGQAHRMKLPSKGNGSNGAAVRWAGHERKPVTAHAPKAAATLASIKPAAVPMGAGALCCWPTWDHTKPKTSEYWASVRAGKPVECGAPRTMRTLPDGTRGLTVYCAEHLRQSTAGPR